MKQRTIFWTLSLTASLLMIWTSFQGLSSTIIYEHETQNWRAQSMGQDLISLGLIIPFYLYTASFMHERKWYFPLLWTGATLYFIYTYIIYCFDVHFNRLFVFYCLILCIHFYSLIYLLFLYKSQTLTVKSPPGLRRITATYFIFISLLFYFLWLTEIIPASLDDSVPFSLETVGLFTNPIHVLDLSFVLPGVLIAGFLVFFNKVTGPLLVPIVLTFLLLMEITIGGLIIILWQKGLESHPAIAWLMFAVAAFDLVLLLLHVRLNTVSA